MLRLFALSDLPPLLSPFEFFLNNIKYLTCVRFVYISDRPIEIIVLKGQINSSLRKGVSENVKQQRGILIRATHRAIRGWGSFASKTIIKDSNNINSAIG